MTLIARINAWLWQRRLIRVERLLRRQRAGGVEVSSRDAKFIEDLRPDELIAQREAQAARRWRIDATYSLELEATRLRMLLNPEPEEIEVMNEFVE